MKNIIKQNIGCLMTFEGLLFHSEGDQISIAARYSDIISLLTITVRGYQISIAARYSDIISLLTITVQGVSDKHCS